MKAKDLKIANDNLYSTNKMLEKEIQRLQNIIKEVREVIEEKCREDLNDEVEIINDKPHSELVEQIYNEHMNYIYGNSPKEDKKIEKLEPLQKEWMTLDDIKFTFSNSEMIIVNKINEIIDRLNGDSNE